MLIQTNNDKETTTYYDTIGELEDILDDLNVDKDKEYNFKISAIMTDGRATVVIIHDWNATHGEKGEKPETPTDNSKKVTLFAADGKLYVDKSITDTTEQAAAIRGWLDANGYSDVDVQIKAGNITAKGSKGGVTYTWSDDTDATIVDTKALVDIKVNGKDVTVHEDATVAQVTGVESDSNNYVLESKTDQAVLTTAKVVAGENYGTTGYVKYTTITVTAPSKWTAGAVTVTKVNKTERSGAAADFVAIGSKITCTLTSKGEVKFPSGDTVTVQYKLALTNGSFDVSKSTYKNWKVTDGAIETQVDETAALTGNVVYIGATDTIGVTYTVQSKTAVAATALNITETAGVSAP